MHRSPIDVAATVFADAAADFIVLLEHGDAGAALCESTGGCETADATSDNHDVWRLQCCTAREDECELHPHCTACMRARRRHASESSVSSNRNSNVTQRRERCVFASAFTATNSDTVLLGDCRRAEAIK